MSEAGGCCRCCFTFILTLGLTALFLWLTLKAHDPSCSIERFYLPALNQSLNTPTNTTIFMTMRLKNGNKQKGIYYDPINISVAYFQGSNRTAWNGSIQNFYQGFGKKANRDVNVSTSGVNWADVVASNVTNVFRVDLSTAIRFKVMFWKTKRHKLTVGANVTLVQQGAKVAKKGVKLKSDGNRMCFCCGFGVFLTLLSLFLLLF